MEKQPFVEIQSNNSRKLLFTMIDALGITTKIFEPEVIDGQIVLPIQLETDSEEKAIIGAPMDEANLRSLLRNVV